MKTDLPRPDISVETSQDGQAHDVVISREGRGKAYRVEGETRQDVIRDVVKKIIEDPYSAEWIPRR